MVDIEGEYIIWLENFAREVRTPFDIHQRYSDWLENIRSKIFGRVDIGRKHIGCLKIHCNVIKYFNLLENIASEVCHSPRYSDWFENIAIRSKISGG